MDWTENRRIKKKGWKKEVQKTMEKGKKKKDSRKINKRVNKQKTNQTNTQLKNLSFVQESFSTNFSRKIVLRLLTIIFWSLKVSE